MTESQVLPLAVQLYSLRNHISDFRQQIETVAKLGYTGVETVTVPNLSAGDIRDILAEFSVKAVSAHIPYAALQADLDELVRYHQTIGNSYAIVPAPPQEVREATDAETWRKFAHSLADFGKRCLDSNIQVGYHNHGWEMKVIDGKRIIEWMLDETDPQYLIWEPDLAWVTHGGGDPEALLKQYAGRCPRVHVKDLARPGENEDEMGLADVGYGTLNWDTLLPAARAAGAEWYIVEHDKPKDAVTSVRRSLEFLRSKQEHIL